MRKLGEQTDRSMFFRITDKSDILLALRAIMRGDQPFAATIFQRSGSYNGWTVTQGGHIIEGHGVISIVTTDNGVSIGLTDVQYNRTVGRVMLDDIGYIETLNPVIVPLLENE
jgi:hypothetical protein